MNELTRMDAQTIVSHLGSMARALESISRSLHDIDTREENERMNKLRGEQAV